MFYVLSHRRHFLRAHFILAKCATYPLVSSPRSRDPCLGTALQAPAQHNHGFAAKKLVVMRSRDIVWMMSFSVHVTLDKETNHITFSDQPYQDLGGPG